MKKKNKYIYLYVVQGDYGYGWEDLFEDCTRKITNEVLMDYRRNDNYVYGLRIIKRRELNNEENN